MNEWGVAKLVYYEKHESHEAAALREKQLKKWNRRWKMRLIEKTGPCWDDLRSGFPTRRFADIRKLTSRASRETG